MSLYGDHLSLGISAGEAGISERLAGMSAVVYQASKRSSLVDQVAAKIGAQAGRGEGFEERQLGILYRWIRDHIVFKSDPFGVADKIRHPDQIIAEINANGTTSCDCDCVATLGATLCAALGFKPVFLLTGRAGDVDHRTGKLRLAHVFYGIRDPRGEAVPFDPQEGVPPAAWPPAEFAGRIEEYEIFTPARSKRFDIEAM